MYQKSVFIFRRDLRLEDNLGLLSALEASEQVIPCFIFDPRQINPADNPYFSEMTFYFMVQSLQELDEALQTRGSRLYVFEGRPTQIVKELITKDKIDAVYANKDYTPFARNRDQEIASVCEDSAVSFTLYNDYTLSPIESIRTNSDTLYTVFTPFMKKAVEHKVPKPHKNNFSNYFTDKLKTATTKLSRYRTKPSDREPILQGGRTEALTIMRKAEYLDDYQNARNLPAEHGTSQLSAHHKFGTVSIRETYHHTIEHKGNNQQFINELYWRDFYYYIAYHFPFVFKQSFLPWAKYIRWRNNKDEFQAWCKGQTGVPMVDAGMRELNHTGWMHNRSRMIVASYLTKNLLIDWRWGEKYFASKLIDYDPAQNNGGWQWSASTGADPKPIRIFNPYTQAQKYDPEAKYIKKWVPELTEVPTDKLTDGKTQDFSQFTDSYPAPLVDQKASYHRAMDTYKQAKVKSKEKDD